MCGFAGCFAPDRATRPELARIATRMRDTLTHRGPDDAGTWVDARAGLALGHRRLSIVDLTPEGSQPMHSASGRYVIAYNGEVYNSQELRAELEGAFAFRGRSDTEVMLAAIECWGLFRALERFVGMFAFALWDRNEQRLWLIRDRLGIKPLYWAKTPSGVIFASELKALRAYPDFDAPIDREALAAYLRYSYVPAPHSIYSGVHKLAPGTALELRAGFDPREHTWWSAVEVAEAGRRDPFAGSPLQAVDRLEELLSDAVAMRMVSDVPLGAFLSGGIDSSTVVALMQAHSRSPIRTFSIGYREDAYDEAGAAREVARHLGSDHLELIVDADEAMAVIRSLPQMYDEPFADSSQIPTHLVCKLAREHVTVALSGDGGDELFCGYNRYLWAPRIWRHIGALPRGVRAGIGKTLTAVSPQAWDRTFDRFGHLVPQGLRPRLPGDKVHKLGAVIGAPSASEMYRSLCSQWRSPLEVARVAREASAPLADATPADMTYAESMMLLDLRTYLPDDILTKVDRASMAVSLEARVPLLDHRVVAFAWSLPMTYKLRQNTTKWALREVLHRHVPKALVDRPKAGFGVPVGDWLRGPLRSWAEELIDPDLLRSQGHFHPEPIHALWQDHLAGRVNADHRLWNVLMFQSWLDRASRDTQPTSGRRSSCAA